MSHIFLVVAGLLVLFMIFSLIRIILGSTTPDRVVALDTINTLVVACMIVLGAGFKEIVFIDVAIVYAMLSFITTLYIAKYLEVSQG
ncbi:MAG: cation:proton antiporter [Deltaproteobacteria bacterium]|nr:cation:proton antiporter [Deltaproteobacteria bacterium]MCD6138956.1 cation:proton antiporter [Deltaproteobacteria bacterium]